METIEAFSECFSGKAKTILTQMIPEYQERYRDYVHETENPATQSRRIKYLTKCFLRLLEQPYFYIQPLAKKRAQEATCWQYPANYPLCDEEELSHLLSTTDEQSFEVIYNGAFVGLCHFDVTCDELVLRFALRPDRLGQGLGEGFYQAIESYATEHYKTKRLCILTSASLLQTFMEKRGYQKDSDNPKLMKTLRD